MAAGGDQERRQAGRVAEQWRSRRDRRIRTCQICRPYSDRLVTADHILALIRADRLAGQSEIGDRRGRDRRSRPRVSRGGQLQQRGQRQRGPSRVADQDDLPRQITPAARGARDTQPTRRAARLGTGRSGRAGSPASAPACAGPELAAPRTPRRARDVGSGDRAGTARRRGCRRRRRPPTGRAPTPSAGPKGRCRLAFPRLIRQRRRESRFRPATPHRNHRLRGP